MALAEEALTDPPTYRCGHPKTAANTVSDMAGRSGKRYDRCRQCKHESVRRWRAKNSPAATGTMLMPRHTKSGRVYERADQPYITKRVWSLLGKPLRDRIAAVVMNDKVDPLQRKVIERAADSRAWTATSSDVAARLFIEALLAQTIDARSSLLRIEVLLDLIFGR